MRKVHDGRVSVARMQKAQVNMVAFTIALQSVEDFGCSSAKPCTFKALYMHAQAA